MDSDRIDALGRALGVRVIIIVDECIDDLYLGEVRYICSFLDATSTRHSNKYKFPVKTGLNSAECQGPTLSDSLAFSSFYLAF